MEGGGEMGTGGGDGGVGEVGAGVEGGATANATLSA